MKSDPDDKTAYQILNYLNSLYLELRIDKLLHPIIFFVM